MGTSVMARPQVSEVLPVMTADDMEKSLACNDLSKMPAELRIKYYTMTCESIGVNPLTKPFILLKNQAGEMVLYATAACAEQLRKRDRISTKVLSRETDDGLYCVTVQASTPDGRCEESQGIVDVTNLKGTPLAVARMKCETKAKRRVTFSLCGLGFATEDDSYGAQPVGFNPQTGEIPLETEELCAVDHEQAKTLDSHISDLFPETDGAMDPRRTPIGQQIDADLAALGATEAERALWWAKMTAKYSGFSPASLSLVADQIQAKLMARQATGVTQESRTPDAPSETPDVTTDHPGGSGEERPAVPVVTGDEDQLEELPF